METFDFTAETPAAPTAPLEGFDFGAPAETPAETLAETPAEPAAETPAFDFTAAAEDPPQTTPDNGLDMMAGFKTEEPTTTEQVGCEHRRHAPLVAPSVVYPVLLTATLAQSQPASDPPASEPPAFTMNSFNPKLACVAALRAIGAAFHPCAPRISAGAC